MGSRLARYVGSSLLAIQATRAGNGEGSVERETGPDCGMRLDPSAEVREGGGQVKICNCIISIGFNCPSGPRGGLLPIAEMELRRARVVHPSVSQRVARAEAQSLNKVKLGFFGVADANLSNANKVMGAGEISIQRQRVFAFGDALRGAPRQNVDISQVHMAAGMVRDRRQGFGQLRFGRRKHRCPIHHKQIYSRD